jgi:UPF0755 protein
MTPDGTEPPIPDDPFLQEDPAAREREARRREREARRREREQRQGAREQDGDRPATPSGPSAADRASAALSGLGERISRKRGSDPGSTSVTPPRHEGSDPGDGPMTFEEPPPQVSEPERYSHATPPPSRGGGIRDRLRRPSPVWIVVGVFIVAVLVFANALFQPFHGGGEGQAVFTIKKGESAGAVADRLDEEGIVSSGTLFEIRLTLAGHRGDVFAGRYVLEEDMSYSEAIDELTKPPSQRSLAITVPEGYSREQIAKLATDSGLEGSYEKASKGSNLINPAKYGAEDASSLEGFLFPSTYELKPKSTADDLVSAQLGAFEKEFAKVDMKFAESQGRTPYEVLIIASMIDREVQLADERKLVSSVIWNRLEQGEPLGIDATIRYATGNYDQPLTQSELGLDSPYNTREVAGLPPTPIGNPGLAAIQAAADPADTDYLFYVVKPGTCGEHVFTETLEEHTAAQARYDEAREAAGGKSPDTC